MNQTKPNKGNILIVDDTPANLKILTSMLTKQGYQVRPALNGQLALTAVQETPPDLILLDIMMPEMGGYQVCQRLKADEQTRDIPIIFISALGQMEDKVKAFAGGGVDYITRPFRIEEVLARVKTHLALRDMQKRLQEQNAQLEQEIAERVQAEETRQELMHVLDERVKELSCLYGISNLVETPDISLEEIVEGTVDLIPPAWQYPEITCARIILEGQEFSTKNFQESPWKQAADILVHGEQSGTVQVGYLQERPQSDEDPFLKEERSLLNAIAERLGGITERKRAAEHIRRSEIQLAALEERERIGRELHDDLGQVMGYVTVQTQAALTRLEQGEAAQVKAVLSQLAQVARQAYGDVRQYILGVRTTAAQPPPDFFAALEGYLDMLHERYGLETQVSWPEDVLESPLAPEVETQLLRIIQEALTNVRKHASVDTARLLFTLHTDEVQVIIEDDGCGFDANQRISELADEQVTQHATRNTQHFGLSIMRERAESVGGGLEVRSASGRGTRVIVRLPLSLVPSPQEGLERGIRVLLVDDHPLYLEGLRGLLASRGLHVVGQARDGLEALEQARSLRPDLILMDVQMPRCDGVEATRRIKAELPEAKIVMLTVAAEGDILFEALKSGASGYLLKSLDGAQFFSLLADVMRGETVLSPALANQVLAEFARKPDDETVDTAPLTPRQHEVLELVAQGPTNQEIARALYVSEATVKYHVSQILERLHLQSRYQLAQYAQERGLAPPLDDE